MEILDGCSQILSSCGVSSQRWLPVRSKSQTSYKVFGGIGVIHSPGHGLSLGVYRQTHTNQMCIYLERAHRDWPPSLLSVMRGTLEPCSSQLFWKKSPHPLSIAPALAPQHMYGRGGLWCPVGSKPGGELRFGILVLSKQAKS